MMHLHDRLAPGGVLREHTKEVQESVLNVSVANSSAVRFRNPWTPPSICAWLRDLFLCRLSVYVCRGCTLWFWQLCLAQTMTSHIPPAYLPNLAVSPALLPQCSLSLGMVEMSYLGLNIHLSLILTICAAMTLYSPLFTERLLWSKLSISFIYE